MLLFALALRRTLLGKLRLALSWVVLPFVFPAIALFALWRLPRD
jgi:hypothetical protein